MTSWRERRPELSIPSPPSPQVGHVEAAFFCTDEYREPSECSNEELDVAGYPLQGCVMVNGMGLAVGRFGRILRTRDGGITWDNIASPTGNHLHGLSMNVDNTHSGSFYDEQACAVSSR